jgi:hypothetical protein
MSTSSTSASSTDIPTKNITTSTNGHNHNHAVPMNNHITAHATNNQTQQQQQLVLWIREWIKLDADQKELNARMVQLKTAKKGLTGSIVKAMQDNGMDEIKASTGSLVRKQKRNKTTISAKYLKEQLTKYFQSSGGQSDELFALINAGRQVKVVDEIEFRA